MGYSWSNGGWRRSNMARLFGGLGEWSLNHGILRPIFGEFDYNDYQSMGRWSDAPIFGSVARTRKTEMENEENERYWQDMARYYGFNPDNIPYPIRSGRYGQVSGGNTVSGGFEASKSVMSLYKPLPRR